LKALGSENPPDPQVLIAQEIVVPRLASLGTTPSQGRRLEAVASVEGSKIEAALEQFCEITANSEQAGSVIDKGSHIETAVPADSLRSEPK
jgi:hypothetical protein